MDLLVIAACCMVFAAVVGAGRPMDIKGPPTALITRDPGATSPKASTADHKRLVATALDIFAGRLDSSIE